MFKKFLVVSFLVAVMVVAPVFSAQATVSSVGDSQTQYVQLLLNLLAQLQALLAQLLAQNPPPTTSCPAVPIPAPDFCPVGQVVDYDKDSNGCSINPHCVPVSCPVWTPPAPDFCPNGTIISDRRDVNGCLVPPMCSTSQPSITVLSPNANFVNAGDTLEIAWQSSGLTSGKKLAVYLERKLPTDTQFWNILTLAQDRIPNINDSYAGFVVGSKYADGSQYKIMVAEMGQSGLEKATESNIFTVNFYSGLSITSVSGPSSLTVNQRGTWKVNVTAPAGRQLTYSVNWGDDDDKEMSVESMATDLSKVQNSGTFTHSYSRAGTYTATFSVATDNSIRCIKAPCPSNANSVTTTMTVVVGGGDQTTTPSCNTLDTRMYTDNNTGLGYIGCDANVNGAFNLAGSYCKGLQSGKKASLVPDGYGRANRYYATLTGLNLGEEVKVAVMSNDGHEVECLPRLNKNAILTNGASFVSQTVPTTATVGQKMTIEMKIKNTGSTTWTKDKYFIVPQNPSFNTNWGFSRAGWMEPSGDVVPGQTATFSGQVTVPATAGSYPFQWQMAKDNVWFGDKTPVVNVLVKSAQATLVNGATFVSQNVPTSVKSGQAMNVSVVMRNSGTTTWKPGEYFLGSQDGATWGLSQAGWSSPTGNVLPGQTATFTGTVYAPTLSISGYKQFQWQMYQVDKGVFGNKTPSVRVIVTTSETSANALSAMDIFYR